MLAPDFLMNAEIMPTVGSIQQMDLFLPLPFGADAVNRRGDENYNLMARLKPGVTMAQAHADVAAIAARIREKDKRDRTFTIDVVSLVESVVGNVRRAVLVVMGSVTLVLLIACANVANLLLTRATARQKEIAVRVALGARWQRLVRQLLTETTLLGLMGGVAGIVVAALALQAIRVIHPGNIPRLDAIGLDGPVLAFTFAVSILTGVLFGLAPALRAARVDLNSTLKAGGRNTQGDGGLGGSRRRLRSLLVVGEVAISLVLLVGAGLLIRSFVQLQRVSPGFDPEGVMSMRLGDGAAVRESRRRRRLLFDVRRAAGERPRREGAGRRVGASVHVVGRLGRHQRRGMDAGAGTGAPGRSARRDERRISARCGFRLIAGRAFTDADLPQNADPVVVIDNKFAQRFWPKGDAIGKHVWFDPAKKFTIVGVVGTVKQYGLDIDGRIVVYLPSPNAGYQVARTSGDPSTVARAMIRKMHEMDPSLTVFDVQTMSARMSGSMARQRFATTMLGVFAAFALVLAVVGVYGVMSNLVTQGSHDIGVRMALGADRSGILLMVLRQGMELTGAGVVAGLLGAMALTRVMASLLFGVSATDVLTFSIVPVVLIATAMLATYLPALRATRVDPTVALREE